ncbi:hypothetical protein, partial [Anaerolinea sp.]|uniref:hypothetical protein n=1 Tax=Anaerolinea sp. TaxID=1872519 RepID=UPI002ACE365C
MRLSAVSGRAVVTGRLGGCRIVRVGARHCSVPFVWTQTPFITRGCDIYHLSDKIELNKLIYNLENSYLYFRKGVDMQITR